VKSYLQACQVPTTHIGQVELPRLIMGIHPYDGCSYVDRDRDQDNLARSPKFYVMPLTRRA
jgi:hypothetical protein